MNKVELSGAAVDTLHALFWFGPREAGEVPSKSGEAELQGYGICHRVDYYNPPAGKDKNLVTLTPVGYQFALEYFIECPSNL